MQLDESDIEQIRQRLNQSAAMRDWAITQARDFLGPQATDYNLYTIQENMTQVLTAQAGNAVTNLAARMLVTYHSKITGQACNRLISIPPHVITDQVSDIFEDLHGDEDAESEDHEWGEGSAFDHDPVENMNDSSPW